MRHAGNSIEEGVLMEQLADTNIGVCTARSLAMANYIVGRLRQRERKTIKSTETNNHLVIIMKIKPGILIAEMLSNSMINNKMYC